MKAAGKKDQNVTRLLVVGRTYTGKSSLCNSNIGQRRFEARGSCHSITNACQIEEAVVQGQNVVMVDTPGLAHTDMTRLENAQLLAREVEGVLVRNPSGFDAILIVVRLGRRLTEEDEYVFTELDHIFGEDYTRTYGIMIVTCADNYDEEENDDLELEECIRQQRGIVKELREKCNNRVIAFDNRTRDESVRKNQVGRLLDTVAEIKNDLRCYTLDAFRRAQKLRDKERMFLLAKK